MNLTKYQASMIIRDAQIRIAEAMKKATELEPQVKDYHAAYIALKDELDSTKEKIEDDKQLLEIASGKFNNVKTGGDFKVLRSESHLEMKDREKKKRSYKHKYNWTDWAEEILMESGRFMSTDDLWSTVQERYAVDATSKEKWGAINNCWRVTKRLYEFKGKIGLQEWKDDLVKHVV